MNTFFRIVIFIIVFIPLSACIPWPWSKVDYKGINIDKFNSYNLPDPKSKFSYLYVNNAFVKIFMRAHDETTISGSSPYRIHVIAYGQEGEQEALIIHSITSYTKSGKKFTLYPVNRFFDNGKLIVDKQKFPVQKRFEKHYDKRYNWNWAYTSTGDTISPSVEEKEIVVTAVDIEVTSAKSTERKTIICEFEPVEKKGFFRSLD